MLLRSANETDSNTLGVLENCPVNLGPFVIWTHFQVVQKAPFGILLGRPFLDLISASEKSYQGGNHDLTIYHPKNGREWKIATYPRIRNEVEKERKKICVQKSEKRRICRRKMKLNECGFGEKA